MNTPNDTLLDTNDQKLDITKCPIFDVFKKKDKRYQQNKKNNLRRLTPLELYELDRRSFVKSYKMIYCPNCGHKHPIPRYIYRQIEQEVKHKWSVDMNNRLTPIQRKTRAIKAGLISTINRGQQFKPSTLQKCTGRRIYKEVASALQIQNPTTT